MIFDTKIDSKGFSAGVSALGKVGANTFKVFAAGATAAAAGVTAIGTAAVKGYADFEQLVGGIETLFGANGAKNVQEYADLVGEAVDDVKEEYEMLMEAQELCLSNSRKAYKDAGLSMNEYMETVSGFAASLKQSVKDEVEAAEAADQAVIDMADNANKMGTNMESIQNAYQGFSKQNYTMLDNLKLGYGGTKTEMERLLSDAEKLHEKTTGEVTHYSIDNLSDVFSAIHDVQVELGITGTTADEAATTISGSTNMMKAAWSNLLVGVADDSSDFDSLVNDFVDSVAIAADNLVPRVEIALSGVGNLVEQILPAIVNRIPEILETTAPKLLETGVQLISELALGIANALPTLLETAFEILPRIIESLMSSAEELFATGYEILSGLIEGIVSAIPEKLPEILVFVQSFADGLAEQAPILIEKGLELLSMLVDGIIQAIPILIENVPTIVSTFANIINDNFPTILMKGVELILQLIKGLLSAIPTLIANIPQIVTAIVDVIEAFEWLNLGQNIVKFLSDGIKGMAECAKNAGSNILDAIKNAIHNLPGQLANIGKSAIYDLASTISGLKSYVITHALQIVSAIEGTMLRLPGKMLSIGKDLVKGLWNGISDMTGWIIDKIGGFAGSVVEGIKDFFDIHSPSRKFKWIGQMCVAGFDEGLEDLADTQTLTKNIDARLRTVQMNRSGVAAFGGAGYGSGGFNQTVNIYQPVSTPDETARAMRLEARYGLIRGEA